MFLLVRLITPVALRMRVSSKDHLQQTQVFFMLSSKQDFLGLYQFMFKTMNKATVLFH